MSKVPVYDNYIKGSSLKVACLDHFWVLPSNMIFLYQKYCSYSFHHLCTILGPTISSSLLIHSHLQNTTYVWPKDWQGWWEKYGLSSKYLKHCEIGNALYSVCCYSWISHNARWQRYAIFNGLTHHRLYLLSPCDEAGHKFAHSSLGYLTVASFWIHILIENVSKKSLSRYLWWGAYWKRPSVKMHYDIKLFT